MYIVTGGAGFIGSNLVRRLCESGADVLVVDELTDGRKFLNLRDCSVSDYLDVAEFRDILSTGRDLPGIEGVFHQGACADTTQGDGRVMLDANFTFSKLLLEWSIDRRLPFVYASSAAVYGSSPTCLETPENERPLNVYGYSKLLFDQYVRRRCSEPGSTVVGLRYFNVYGPGEAHKGKMASMAYQLWRQIRDTGEGRLFRGANGVADGEQRRDFVNVRDVVEVNLFFMKDAPRRGIFNVGTGESRSFNDLARIIIGILGKGRVVYIPFPSGLSSKYQDFTQADLTQLRGVGFSAPFTHLERGLSDVLKAWQTETSA